jgi:hypothetical protein
MAQAEASMTSRARLVELDVIWEAMHLAVTFRRMSPNDSGPPVSKRQHQETLWPFEPPRDPRRECA